METLNIILPVISGLLCGGATWLVTIKYTRRQAEADAMQHFQTVYQGLIKDLQEDRTNLKTELLALKKQQTADSERIRKLEEAVHANTRILNQLAKYAKDQSLKCKDCVLIELINKSQI